MSRALTPPVLQIDSAFGGLGWVAKLCEPWDAPLDRVPRDIDLHEHAQIALAWQAVLESTQMPIVHCFVDGSTSKEGAGWAVVVVSETRDMEGHCAFALKGVLAGPVELAPQQEEWVGAEAATNIAAEFTALLVAQAYVLANELPEQSIIYTQIFS